MEKSETIPGMLSEIKEELRNIRLELSRLKNNLTLSSGGSHLVDPFDVPPERKE